MPVLVWLVRQLGKQSVLDEFAVWWLSVVGSIAACGEPTAANGPHTHTHNHTQRQATCRSRACGRIRSVPASSQPKMPRFPEGVSLVLCCFPLGGSLA